MSNLKNIFNILNLVVLPIIGSTFLFSCSEENTIPNPESTIKDSTVLVYAVATNSLSGALVDDKNEMLRAAPDINLDKNNVLVFETRYAYSEDNTRISKMTLVKLVKTGDSYEWESIKDYTDGVASLDPERITEVINYVTDQFPAKNYGLVFWSHSTASQPYIPATKSYSLASDTADSIEVSLPMVSSFGQDLTWSNGDNYYQINVDDLAKAVPDDLFSFIWFDSCYMSNIETIYQFRDKCSIFVGYPTEVIDSGLPYQNVLPYMVGENPDLIRAAELFDEFYSNSFGTIAVIDMNKIDSLAEFWKNNFEKGIEVSESSLMKYTRSTTGPFYDLEDYAKSLAEVMDKDFPQAEWNEVMEKCIKYKGINTRIMLSGLYLNEDRYSGISTHKYSYKEEDSDSEKFYKTLEWYKAAFE